MAAVYRPSPVAQWNNLDHLQKKKANQRDTAYVHNCKSRIVLLSSSPPRLLWPRPRHCAIALDLRQLLAINFSSTDLLPPLLLSLSPPHALFLVWIVVVGEKQKTKNKALEKRWRHANDLADAESSGMASLCPRRNEATHNFHLLSISEVYLRFQWIY